MQQTDGSFGHGYLTVINKGRRGFLWCCFWYTKIENMVDLVAEEGPTQERAVAVGAMARRASGGTWRPLQRRGSLKTASVPAPSHVRCALEVGGGTPICFYKKKYYISYSIKCSSKLP